MGIASKPACACAGTGAAFSLDTGGARGTDARDAMHESTRRQTVDREIDGARLSGRSGLLRHDDV